MFSYAKQAGKLNHPSDTERKKALKFTDSKMMKPKMRIYHSSHSKDIEDINVLIELRSVVNISQSLVESRV